MALSLQDSRFHQLTDLVIDISVDDDASNILTSDAYGMFDFLTFIHLGTATGALTVYVVDDPDSDETADASWAQLQNEGQSGAVTVPDGGAVTFRVPAAPAIRIQSAGTEVADRTIKAYGRRSRAHR